MQNLSIELLRTFAAIVETGSFAAAASRVFRTESAVVQQMQRLEKQLGRELFRKAGRTKQLTDDGYKVLDYAHQLLRLNDEAWSALTGNALKGEVRLGAPHDITETLLPDVLTHCSKHFPELQVSIHMGRSPHLIQALRDNQVDLTIAALDAYDLQQFTLRTSPIVWMCASKFSPDLSRPLPLIVADESSFFRKTAIQALDAAHISWRVTYTSPNVVGVKAAIKAGLGITARSIEMLDSDLRVMSDMENLPKLPNVSFRMYLNPRTSNTSALRLFESLQALR